MWRLPIQAPYPYKSISSILVHPAARIRKNNLLKTWVQILFFTCKILTRKQTSKRSTTSAWAEKRSGRRTQKISNVCILSKRRWTQEGQLACEKMKKYCECVEKACGFTTKLTHGRRSSKCVPCVCRSRFPLTCLLLRLDLLHSCHLYTGLLTTFYPDDPCFYLISCLLKLYINLGWRRVWLTRDVWMWWVCNAVPNVLKKKVLWLAPKRCEHAVTYACSSCVSTLIRVVGSSFYSSSFITENKLFYLNFPTANI